MKLRTFEAVRHEERFYVFLGVTLILGIYLTFSSFGA